MRALLLLGAWASAVALGVWAFCPAAPPETAALAAAREELVVSNLALELAAERVGQLQAELARARCVTREAAR